MPNRLPLMPVLAGLMIVILSFVKTPARTSSKTITNDSPNTVVNTVSAETLYKEPKTISIPDIGLSAPIVLAGYDHERRMEIPSDNKTASWWKYGTLPGEMGSAVIAGHYKVADGSPGVFFNLDKIAVGNKIQVSFSDGSSKVFTVIERRTYTESEFPVKAIYAKKGARRLNLVTCSGKYNAKVKDYSHRLVVFAQINEE